jgi:glycosyltransferase involved in cell wall biosynthesis
MALPSSPTRVLLCVEQRFEKTPDGEVWTGGHYPYDFLKRYLEAGRELVVLARIRDVGERPTRARRASGPGVRWAPLPQYRGALEFFLCGIGIARAVVRAACSTDAILVRAPSMTGSTAAWIGRSRGVPIFAEVIGDPNEVFAPGHFDHPLRAVMRAASARSQAYVCRKSLAACYVSHGLAKRYPCAGHAYVCADCVIPPDWFAQAPRRNFTTGHLRIVAIGTMEVPYKRHDVLLRALALATEQAAPVQISLDLVGDGRLRADLEQLATSLGVTDRVTFHGFIADRSELRGILEQADLMVHTSVTEGMPNVIIEAMAQGLPCLGTPVGGIPELLPQQCLVPVADVEALSREIVRLAQAPEALEMMSAQNLARSSGFSQAEWQKRFHAFIRHLPITQAPDA